MNDATTVGAATTNTSYLYGDLLFGGTAPVEQITTTSAGSTADFIVASPTGVKGVYSSSGASLEQALYSTYGVQTITSGVQATQFGFQGSYADSTGLIYLINRYYDPSTDQFLSIDPMVAATGQPYVFTNDNPLNSTDPLGLSGKTTNKKYRQRIDSLQKQIKLHKRKIANNPDSRDVPHWQGEIKGWQGEVGRLQRRLNSQSTLVNQGSSIGWGILGTIVLGVAKVAAAVVCGVVTSETGPGAVVAGASCASVVP